MTGAGICAGAMLRQAAACLRQSGLDEPRLEAEVLLSHAWGKRREDFLIHPEQEVPEPAVSQYRLLVDRRRKREPLAYLTGAREFMSLKMTVTPSVLIPRPETELLVEQVLRWLASRQGGEGAARERPLVADIGTGCGAIAVSLAAYNPSVRVIATDISPDALQVAAVNAGRHGVADRISFRPGDLMAPLLEPGNSGGGVAVAANLPYITTGALAELPLDVQQEPHLALDGGADGLDLYRRLAPQAASWLAPGGLLACEIAPEQAEAWCELLESGGWQEIRVTRDYRGEDRVVAALRGARLPLT